MAGEVEVVGDLRRVEVLAGAEAAAGAGQDEDAGAGGGLAGGGEDLAAHGGVEAVPDLGAVERERRDAVRDGEEDRLVAHRPFLRPVASRDDSGGGSPREPGVSGRGGGRPGSVVRGDGPVRGGDVGGKVKVQNTACAATRQSAAATTGRRRRGSRRERTATATIEPIYSACLYRSVSKFVHHTWPPGRACAYRRPDAIDLDAVRKDVGNRGVVRGNRSQLAGQVDGNHLWFGDLPRGTLERRVHVSER